MQFLTLIFYDLFPICHPRCGRDSSAKILQYSQSEEGISKKYEVRFDVTTNIQTTIQKNAPLHSVSFFTCGFRNNLLFHLNEFVGIRVMHFKS